MIVQRRSSVVLSLVVAIGIFLRLFHLSSFPSGVHGDEGWTGIRGRDALRGEHIGVYDNVHSVGQPAGQSYAAAASIALFGDTVWAIRFVSAAASIVGLICFAVFVRHTLPGLVAQAGAVLFYASSDWEGFLARVAFPPVFVPALMSAALLSWCLAERRSGPRRSFLYAATGGLAASGLYFYGGAIPFVFLLPVFLSIRLITSRADSWKRDLFALLGGFIPAAVPMMLYAVLDSTTALSRVRRYAVWDFDRILRSVAFIMRGLFIGGPPDDSDGLGIHALLPGSLSIALLLGLFALSVRPRPEKRFFLFSVLLLFGALLFDAVLSGAGFGDYRRLIAAFVPLVWLGGAGCGIFARRIPRASALLFLAISVESVVRWSEDAHSKWVRTVYCEEISEASKALRDRYPDSYVYFFSARWSFDYETRRYLAPAQRGENRSREFGRYSLEKDRSKVVFVLMDKYISLEDELRRKYPEARVEYGSALTPYILVAPR